jgi:hypothetical protein
MKRPSVPRRPQCECEAPGLFRSGVPGILAHVVDGRLVPGAPVECCPRCRRYPSDAAALVRLQELGIVGDAPVTLAAYTVHVYVTVSVKLTGILAGTPREAARSAQQGFSWEEHSRAVEFVDELHELLVDVQGDPDYSRSVAFRADLEPVR